MYFKYNLKAIVTSNVLYPFSIVRHHFLIYKKNQKPTKYLRYVKKNPRDKVRTMHCKYKPVLVTAKFVCLTCRLQTWQSEADEIAARLLVCIRGESSTNSVFILSNLSIHRYCDSFSVIFEFDYHK